MLSSKTGVATLSVLSNTALVLIKLAAGISMGSVSVISEAIHSSVDLAAAIIALFSVHVSKRPPDDTHHYGHGKVENVSGTIEALLIFVAALIIIYEAVGRIRHGSELVAVDFGLGVMAFSAVVNILVSRKLMAVARRTESVALEADAYHLTTDVLTSVGVFVGLLVVRLTGLSILDPLIAIGVALVIIKAAYDITRKSFLDLLDQSLPAEEQERIASVLKEHTGRLLVGYHQIRSRKAGPERYVDMHLVMNRAATVEESHALCDHLEEHLKEELGTSSLNIHVEPCPSDCDHCGTECNGEQSDHG